jgi:hypothetical protein
LAFTVDLQGQPTDFIRWAEHYVNQLDPLHPEPRGPDFAHERTFQVGADEKRAQEELQRLLGHTCEHGLKLADAAPRIGEQLVGQRKPNAPVTTCSAASVDYTPAPTSIGPSNSAPRCPVFT